MFSPYYWQQHSASFSNTPISLLVHMVLGVLVSHNNLSTWLEQLGSTWNTIWVKESQAFIGTWQESFSLPYVELSCQGPLLKKYLLENEVSIIKYNQKIERKEQFFEHLDPKVPEAHRSTIESFPVWANIFSLPLAWFWFCVTCHWKSSTIFEICQPIQSSDFF